MRKLYGHSERRAAARPAARRLGQAGGLLPFTTGLALVVIAAGLLGSCATAPASREEKATLVEEARARLQQMQRGPGLGALLQKAGYALFPDVGKAGLGVGGAYGRGVVYERGQHIGYSDLTQASVGLQVGAKASARSSCSRPRPPGALQGGPGQLRGGGLGRGAQVGRRHDPQLRRRCGRDRAPHRGDDGSRHWRAAVHLSGQVSPATLGQPRSGWEPSAARARAVERCGEAGSIYPGWGPGRHASVLFPVAVRNATAPSYGLFCSRCRHQRSSSPPGRRAACCCRCTCRPYRTGLNDARTAVPPHTPPRDTDHAVREQEAPVAVIGAYHRQRVFSVLLHRHISSHSRAQTSSRPHIGGVFEIVR